MLYQYEHDLRPENVVEAAITRYLYQSHISKPNVKLAAVNKLFAELGFEKNLPAKKRRRIYIPLSTLVPIKSLNFKTPESVQQFIDRYQITGFELHTGLIQNVSEELRTAFGLKRVTSFGQLMTLILDWFKKRPYLTERDDLFYINGQKLSLDIVSNVYKTFEKDPQRQGARALAQGYIVISRHPYDLMGMSFERGWTSCMDLGSGFNSHYIKADIEHGTLICYLLKQLPASGVSRARPIVGPTARVLIKPVRHVKNNSLAFAIDPFYGQSSPVFKHAIQAIANKLNVGIKGGLYKLVKGLYMDQAYPVALFPENTPVAEVVKLVNDNKPPRSKDKAPTEFIDVNLSNLSPSLLGPALDLLIDRFLIDLDLKQLPPPDLFSAAQLSRLVTNFIARSKLDTRHDFTFVRDALELKEVDIATKHKLIAFVVKDMKQKIFDRLARSKVKGFNSQRPAITAPRKKPEAVIPHEELKELYRAGTVTENIFRTDWFQREISPLACFSVPATKADVPYEEEEWFYNYINTARECFVSYLKQRALNPKVKIVRKWHPLRGVLESAMSDTISVLVDYVNENYSEAERGDVLKGMVERIGEGSVRKAVSSMKIKSTQELDRLRLIIGQHGIPEVSEAVIRQLIVRNQKAVALHQLSEDQFNEEQKEIYARWLRDDEFLSRLTYPSMLFKEVTQVFPLQTFYNLDYINTLQPSVAKQVVNSSLDFIERRHSLGVNEKGDKLSPLLQSLLGKNIYENSEKTCSPVLLNELDARGHVSTVQNILKYVGIGSIDIGQINEQILLKYDRILKYRPDKVPLKLSPIVKHLLLVNPTLILGLPEDKLSKALKIPKIVNRQQKFVISSLQQMIRKVDVLRAKQEAATDPDDAIFGKSFPKIINFLPQLVNASSEKFVTYFNAILPLRDPQIDSLVRSLLTDGIMKIGDSVIYLDSVYKDADLDVWRKDLHAFYSWLNQEDNTMYNKKDKNMLSDWAVVERGLQIAKGNTSFTNIWCAYGTPMNLLEALVSMLYSKSFSCSRFELSTINDALKTDRNNTITKALYYLLNQLAKSKQLTSIEELVKTMTIEDLKSMAGFNLYKFLILPLIPDLPTRVSKLVEPYTKYTSLIPQEVVDYSKTMKIRTVTSVVTL